jgi:hypothetical protein
MHHFCALPPVSGRTSVKDEEGILPGSGVAPVLGQCRFRKPALPKAVSAFHKQTPLFRKEMRGMQRKYKILWFAVDIYHRQRYFSICGFKQTVTCFNVRASRKAPERREVAVL